MCIRDRGCFEAWQQDIKAGTLMKIATAVGILAASLVALSFIDSVVAPPELVIGGAGQHVLHAVEVRLRHGRAEIHFGQDVVRVDVYKRQLLAHLVAVRPVLAGGAAPQYSVQPDTLGPKSKFSDC